jgi:hypothetical protein
MSPLDPEIPPVGEEIHLPGGSIQPLLLTIGLTVALVGVTFNWWVCGAGGVLALATLVRWVRDNNRDIAELPVHTDGEHH